MSKKLKKDNYDPMDHLLTIEEVATIYLSRNSIYSSLWREGIIHKGNKGWKRWMWFPRPIEVASCCLSVAPPALTNPRSYYEHCKTYIHLATLYQVDLKMLKLVASNLAFLDKIEVAPKKTHYKTA